MASSPFNLRASSYHVRSISLPSRSHPLTVNVEQQLCHLRSSAATTSCSSSSSTSYNLNGLTALHDSIEDLLQLSSTQKALISNGRSDSCMIEILDGSLRLLEFCSSTRDVVSQIKECVQELQSCIRRRKDLGLANDIGAYMIARKKINKMIQKCSSDMKKSENKCASSSLLGKDHNVVAIIGVHREVEALTFSMLKSLLCSLSSSKTQALRNSWSVVSKLMRTKSVASQEEESDLLGLKKLEPVLLTIIAKKSCKAIEIISTENVQTQLEAAELSLQCLDDGLECIYKSLIKTRVSLLNISSQ